MTAARVGRLTLAAPDEALVRRGAILLEDAMNIATLQAASDHRAYVVRHFDVGVIGEDAAPHTLALQIEQRLAGIQRFAVPATDAAAATATAVWFVDDLTAIAELARRIAAGPRPVEWFWPHVAAGAVKLPAPFALRACLAAAARTPAVALAVAFVVDAIETAREGAFLGTLEPSDAAVLIAVAFGGAPPAHPRAAAPPGRRPPSRIDTRWFARLVRWIARWGGDARAQWLAALAQVQTRGALRAPAVELASAAELVAALAPPAVPPPVEAPREPTAPSHAVPALEAAGEALSAEPAREPRPRIQVAEVEVTVLAPLASEDAFASVVTGVLLLVRPLGALGIAIWLDDHDWAGRTGFGAQLLALLAAGQLAGEPDPLVDALGEGRAIDSFAASWAAIAWAHALATWLERFTELRLSELIARPGAVVATATHLEVTWPLRAADLRIRAAGLDVDPGWVPWLGRIVRFHYDEVAR